MVLRQSEKILLNSVANVVGLAQVFDVVSRAIADAMV